ncbi:MAG: ComEC/Rec2 family competence protein [bacterium]
MIKSNPKLIYEYVKNRVDLISLSIGVFLVGYYLGVGIKGDFFLFFFLILCFIVLIIYKKVEFVILFIFIFGIFYSFQLFSFLSTSNVNVDSSVDYVGSYKIISIKRLLWYSEKVVMNNSYFFPTSGSRIKCTSVENFEFVTDPELINQGIRRSATCIKAQYYSDNSTFVNIRNRLSQNFDSFNYDTSNVLKGITLGIKPPQELNEAFRNAGISHILVISGFNITLILLIITQLIKKLPTFYKIYSSIFFVVIFVLIVGPTAPVLRAAVMGFIAYLATFQFKNLSYVRILLISVIIMLFLDNYILFNVSFHLSFLATLGIILFGNITRDLFKILPDIIGVPFSQSLSAGVFTIPYTINVFSSFSPMLLFTNIMVIPYISLLSILAYLYMIFPNILFRFPLEIMSNFIIQLVLFISSFSLSNMPAGIQIKELVLFILFVIISLVVGIYVVRKLLLYTRIAKKCKFKYYC